MEKRQGDIIINEVKDILENIIDITKIDSDTLKLAMKALKHIHSTARAEINDFREMIAKLN